MNELTELAYKGGESLSTIKLLKESSIIGDTEITTHMDSGEKLVFDPFATLDDVMLSNRERDSLCTGITNGVY